MTFTSGRAGVFGLALAVAACADRPLGPVPAPVARPSAVVPAPAPPVASTQAPEPQRNARDATIPCELGGKPGAALPGGECSKRLRKVVRLYSGSRNPNEGLHFASQQNGALIVAGDHREVVRSERGVRTDRYLSVARFSPDLSLEWSHSSARVIGGVGAQALAVAQDGGTLISAHLFSGRLKFAGGRLEGEVGAPQGRDAALIELDREGRFAWGRLIGGKGNVDVKAITGDDDGSVFVAGSFGGDADFGEGTIESPVLMSLFLARYTRAGSLVWQRVFPMARQWAYGVELGLVVQGKELVFAGDFYQTLDLGEVRFRHHQHFFGPRCLPGRVDPHGRRPGPSSHRSKSIFFARFTLDGKLVAASELETPGGWFGSLSLAQNGDVLLSGAFQQRIEVLGRTLRGRSYPAYACSCDVDCPLRQHDAFLIRVGPEGRLVWARHFEGGNARPLALPSGAVVLHRTLSTAAAPRHWGDLKASFEARLEHFNAEGELLWEERSSKPIGKPLRIDAEGRLIVGGAVNGEPALLYFDTALGG